MEPFTFSVITRWAGILSEMTPAQKAGCWADLLAFQQVVNAVVLAGCPTLDRP